MRSPSEALLRLTFRYAPAQTRGNSAFQEKEERCSTGSLPPTTAHTGATWPIQTAHKTIPTSVQAHRTGQSYKMRHAPAHNPLQHRLALLRPRLPAASRVQQPFAPEATAAR